MKKTYIIPATAVLAVDTALPMALSDPNIKVNNDDDEIPPGSAQAKEHHYNVWDDDWSEAEDKSRWGR